MEWAIHGVQPNNRKVRTTENVSQIPSVTKTEVLDLAQQQLSGCLKTVACPVDYTLNSLGKVICMCTRWRYDFCYLVISLFW